VDVVQKRENPYAPGAGRKPPNLAGRDLDLENFQSLIESVAQLSPSTKASAASRTAVKSPPSSRSVALHGPLV
jgi:hypothetical protein